MQSKKRYNSLSSPFFSISFIDTAEPLVSSREYSMPDNSACTSRESSGSDFSTAMTDRACSERPFITSHRGDSGKK